MIFTKKKAKNGELKLRNGGCQTRYFKYGKNGNGKSGSENHERVYLQSIEYFKKRYMIEQRRAERSGYEFSLLIVDLNPVDYSNGSNNNNTDDLCKSENILFTAIDLRTRETDVIVKYWPGKIALLLPDTNYNGAQIVLQRINIIFEEITIKAIRTILKNYKIYSFTYPSQDIEMSKFINNKMFDTELSISELEKKTRNIQSFFKKQLHLNETEDSGLNLSANGTLVLENPFCLLNQVFFSDPINWQVKAKRFLDIVCSALGIVLLLPAILLVSIIVKLTSKGPVFFKQKRIGYLGKEFTFYKFRTMYADQSEDIHKKYISDFIHDEKKDTEAKDKIYKMTNDPRVTPIGQFLRRTSIDEIGQLFNVLKGDMSLVGPRPPIPYEVEMYELWHNRRFLTMKPGITGMWQIYGRSSTSFNEMVRMDLDYIKNWSLLLDFKLLFKTVWVVLTMKGAY